jgi:creatinine amidohydrolase
VNAPVSRRLGELTAPQSAELIGESSIVILPLGAIEQHGPHLPLATDLIVVDALAEAVVAEFGERLDLWLLPTLPYSNSGEHVWSPGTVAHSPETLLAMARDIGRSLARLRSRRIVLLNGHGGNTSLLDVVCRELRIAHGMLTFLLHGSLPADHGGAGHPAEDGLGIHGGLSETSVMLHLRPDLVHPDRFVSNVPRWLNERPHVRFGGGAGFGWLADDFGPSGVIGDATLADADVGKVLFERSVAYLGEVLADVATFDFPGREPR